MNLVEHLRNANGLSQAEFAEEFGVSQPAISLYESGRRSPNLDKFVEAAAKRGQRVVLVPASIEPPHDRSERFGRLLHLRVAEHFLRDPHRVRSIAHENLARFPDSAPVAYNDEWRRLLGEGRETELFTVLCIPDRNNTGLLSSSPFAGVIADDERHELLDMSRSA
jgi:transcriptional regulator with XRE-family HTH domain